MRVPLTTKITGCTLGVLFIALVNGIAGIYSAYLYRSYVNAVTDENLASVRAALELEIALLEQRGYATSHVLDDGQGDWLRQLEEKRKVFDHWLVVAKGTAFTNREQEILRGVEAAQSAYAAKREQVLERFRRGDVKAAKAGTLYEMPVLYQQAYDLCEEFIDINNELAEQTNTKAHAATENLVILLIATSTGSFGLGGGLLWMFLGSVVRPLRRMANDVRRVSRDPVGNGPDRDEMNQVGRYLRVLMADVVEVREALERSQERLRQTERLATVGKLAASVAHEIRNPLTAIKVWLYSLRREVGGLPDVRRQFDSIGDEISRLEHIVQSFLEFSRPPQMRIGQVNVTELLERTHELLRARLSEVGVSLRRRIEGELPVVTADGEQLRQVLLNLLNNSLDAMSAGGRIDVTATAQQRDGVAFVVVRVADTGSGLSPQAQEKLFEPFFSTKQHGTGLGLCVAASIMGRHAGAIRLERSSAEGTEFAVWIPVESAVVQGIS